MAFAFCDSSKMTLLTFLLRKNWTYLSIVVGDGKFSTDIVELKALPPTTLPPTTLPSTTPPSTGTRASVKESSIKSKAWSHL